MSEDLPSTTEILRSESSMRRRVLQLRHAGKAVLTCIVAVNLLCFLTLYTLHTRPVNDTPLPWQTRDQAAAQAPARKEAGGLDGVGVLEEVFDSPCKEIRHAPTVPDVEDTWRTVVANGTYVYSAYYDLRGSRRGASVVILGMSSGKAPNKWCQLWYPGRLLLAPAQYDIVPETHDRKYAPSFHTCQVEVSDPPPYALSLVVNKCDVSSSYLRLHPTTHPQIPAYPAPVVNQHAKDSSESQPFKFHAQKNLAPQDGDQAEFKYNYTVCVTPFNFRYNNVHQLVEMIEVNRMFGADHFVFYNYDSAPEVAPYLKYYTALGIAEVLPWDLPVKVNVWPPVKSHHPEIHYFAQLVALNDCVYRSMLDSRYAVLTDLDEIIVPQADDSWDSMLDRVTDKNHPVGSWMFQNTFFRMDWDDSGTDDPLAKKYELRTLLKTNHEAQIFPPYSRSKLIVKPQAIGMTGIHFVYKHMQRGQDTLNVEPHNGLLHHYRIGFGGEEKGEIQVEWNVMLKYKNSIIHRVKRTYDAVGLENN